MFSNPFFPEDCNFRKITGVLALLTRQRLTLAIVQSYDKSCNIICIYNECSMFHTFIILRDLNITGA